MDSLKEKLSSSMKYIQNTIISNYKIIEQQQKIFYFSKFSIDIDDFYRIYLFIHQIKKNVYNLMYDILKICVTNYISFNNDNEKKLTENQKMITIYSACLKHYYLKYTFNINNSFEDFCSSDFNTILNEFNIKIINEKQFKIFLFYFYSTIQKEIKNLNYEKVNNLKKYYNPNIKEKNDNNKHYNNNMSIDEDINSNNQSDNNSNNSYFQKIHSNLCTFLAGTKARIVDMVFEFKIKNKISNDKKEIEFINEAIQKITQMSRDFIKSQTINNKDTVIKIENSNNHISKNTNENIPSYYSKRVLSEVVKLDMDEETEKKIILISKKIEESYLDKMLNSKYKMIKVLDHFICYIVEFNSKMIKSIFKDETFPEDVSIRFIVPAKEIFNLTFEFILLLSNLPYTTINTFLQVGVKLGLQYKYCLTLYDFFKEFLQCLFNEKGNLHDVNLEVLKKFYDKQFSIWEKQIQEKGKNLTSYYEC